MPGIVFKIVINTSFGILLVFIWLKFVNLEEVLKTLSDLQIINIVPIFVFMFVSPLIRSIRLKIFLRPVAKINLLDLTFLNGFALMLNFLVPIRGGEIAKAIYLGSKYNLPVTKGLVWIFLDRFVDFLVVLMLSVILLFLIPTSLNITFITIITIIFLLGLILSYLVVFQSQKARKLFKLLSNFLIVRSIKLYFDKVCEFFLDSLSILKRGKGELFLLFSISVLAYGADALIIYFGFIAINSHLSFLNSYLAQLLTALTYLIPSPPGYVGLTESSGLLVFSGVLGLDKNLASSVAVLLHVLIAIFVMIFGLISIYFLKIDLGSILKKIFRREG